MYAGPFRTMASVAVTAGQLVKLAGEDLVTPTTAIADQALGTVVVDAAAGAPVSVLPLPGIIREVTASAAVSVGNLVEPSTVAGQVKPLTSGTRVGIALTTAAGSPLKLKILGG